MTLFEIKFRILMTIISTLQKTWTLRLYIVFTVTKFDYQYKDLLLSIYTDTKPHDGVMVKVVASNVVARGFKPLSGQNKDNKTGIKLLLLR